MHCFLTCYYKADVIAPPKEITENSVVDDFDVGDEEIAIEHRYFFNNIFVNKMLIRFWIYAVNWIGKYYFKNSVLY